MVSQLPSDEVLWADPIADAAPIVFVVDDDSSVRAWLEQFIISRGWRVVSFASASEFLSHERAAVPSCLILDFSLPDINGLELQKRVGDERATLPIIFVTAYGDIAISVEAMKAGAVEFLQKPLDNDRLIGAVRAAVEGSRVALDLESELHDLQHRYASLTVREREVMALVVLGLTNKQVGRQLDITEITVKVHRGRVMEKTGARSLADLVRMAVKLGLPTGSNGGGHRPLH